MQPMSDNDAKIKATDRKIARTRRLSTTFALTAIAGNLAMAGGVTVAMGTFAYSASTQKEFSIVHAPAQKYLNLISTTGIVAGIGFGGMVAAGFSLDASSSRRRKLQQQKYSLTVNMIKDSLKPSGTKP